MPLPHFLASNRAMRATTKAAMMIWQSKIMTLGVVCEILAVIAAVSSWFNNLLWLPNATLTLATLGAVVVATKISWDYHGRGLNAQQRHDVGGILTGASLNQTQSNEIAEAIQSSGLTPRQKSDLAPALREMNVAQIVEAQRAVNYALEYLNQPGHGQVIVILAVGINRLDVRYVQPPQVRDVCQRQHAFEDGTALDLTEVAKSLFWPFNNPTVLWTHPGNGLCYSTNYNARAPQGHELRFSFEDCIPKWGIPAPGDYVLRHDLYNGSYWQQQP